MKKLIILITILAMCGCQAPSRQKTAALKPSKVTSEPVSKLKTHPWQFLQYQGQLSIPNNKRIVAERDKLLKNKLYLERLFSRAEPYMFYIVNQLHQRNMPVELALMPLLESAYNPQATSPAKAAGLWQMMPTTAQSYGMTANKWYDPRRDLIDSTEAALNYLQYLNHYFDGDWLLTIAAYNSGEGRIKRAQQWNSNNNLPNHYWALNLPNETMQYVPKLLALIDILREHNLYGISLPDCDYQNALVQIVVGEKIDLETLAQYTDLSVDQLATYNAGHLKQTINGPYHLLVPNHQAQALYKQLVKQDYPDSQLVDLLTLPVSQSKYRSSSAKPTNLKYLSVTDSDLALYAKEHLRHSQIIYRVKPGDNLSNIAKNHHVKVTQLIQWNNLSNAHRLKPGERIVINVRQ